MKLKTKWNEAAGTYTFTAEVSAEDVKRLEHHFAMFTMLRNDWHEMSFAEKFALRFVDGLDLLRKLRKSKEAKGKGTGISVMEVETQS